MNKIIFMSLLIMFSQLSALDELQEYVIKTAYKVGKSVKAKDGMSFENTLVGITLQESSAGKDLIGDKYEDKYYYIHWENGHKNKVYVKKKDTFVKDGERFYLYKGKWKKNVYILKGQLRSLYDSSLGAFQIRLATAKFVIRKYFPNKYKYLLEDEDLLVKKLLANIKFSATIAAHYLKMNYEEALNRKISNPWFRSISRYNGGWNNTTYYNNVLKRIKFFKKTQLRKELKRRIG